MVARLRRSAAPSGFPRTALLLLLAYGLLMASWIATNPPGFASDEPAHYVKAIGIGRGEVRGQPAAYSFLPTLDQRMLRWQNANARSVWVPRGLGECLYFRLPIYGRCPEGPTPPTPAREITYVGSYPPFAYVGAAALMRLGHSTYTALLLGRAASAGLCLLLLAGAAWALARGGRGRLALVGLVITVTPMVLFTGAELSPSGLEITAGICLAAALLRLAREPEPPGRLWLVALVSGVVLVITRQLGPLWLVVDAAWFTVLVGVRPALAVLRRGGRWTVASGAALAAAAVANITWQVIASPRLQVGRQAVSAGVRLGVRHLGRVAAESIGSFGWTDVPLPHAALIAWAVMIIALIAVALRYADSRERLALLGLIGAVLAITLGISVALTAASPRFPVQARYAMPVGVAVPLLAGEIAHRHRHRLGAHLEGILLSAALTVAAVVHAWSLQVNAEYYLHNQHGYLSFIQPRRWDPPGGWTPWVVVVAAAVVIFGVLLVDGWRAQREPPPGRVVTQHE